MKFGAVAFAVFTSISLNADANQIIDADVRIEVGIATDNGRPSMCALKFDAAPAKRQGSTTGIIHAAFTVLPTGLVVVSGKVGEADNREMSLKGKKTVWRMLTLDDVWFQLPGGERTQPFKDKRTTDGDEHIYYVRFAKLREFTDAMQEGAKIQLGYKDKARKEGVVLSGKVTLEPAQFQKLGKCVEDLPQASK